MDYFQKNEIVRSMGTSKYLQHCHHTNSGVVTVVSKLFSVGGLYLMLLSETEVVFLLLFCLLLLLTDQGKLVSFLFLGGGVYE